MNKKELRTPLSLLLTFEEHDANYRSIRDALNPADFALWLDSKEKGALVGIRAHNDRCPLALYLKEKFPVYEFQVDEEDVLCTCDADDELEFFKTPGWASDFVCRVDALAVDRITMLRARRVLDFTCCALGLSWPEEL